MSRLDRLEETQRQLLGQLALMCDQLERITEAVQLILLAEVADEADDGFPYDMPMSS